MCRLFGNIGLKNNSESISEKEFRFLTLLSKAGGPDHTGYFMDDHVWFGFNRLSILDVSDNGNQPIFSPSKRFITMLNGEIYNFKELIDIYDLSELRSNSDSEVVCQLIDKIGYDKTIPLLEGMFAIVCWDFEELKLKIARDFAGIKPLFYTSNENGFVFSSQFDQIIMHPWLKNWDWNELGLGEYFSMGYMVSPNTIVKGVYSVQPGEMIEFNLNTGEVSHVLYESFFKEHDTARLMETSKETVNLVHETLKQSVKSQMISDVPLGVYLSGGIDSTLISAISKEINPELSSITIGFEDMSLDESTAALAYANHLKIENKQFKLGRKEAKNLLQEHNEKLTEPIADISSIPTFFANKMASTYFKVMLSGDGGDELFWGYPRYQKIANSRFLFRIPSLRGRKAFSKLLDRKNELFSNKLSAITLGEANLKHSQTTSFSDLSQVLGLDTELNNLIRDFELKSLKKSEILQGLRQNDFYYFLQKVLVKVDRNSMSNGLEVRVPFLDLQMIKLAEQIKPELTMGHQIPKFITKEILKRYIPVEQIDQSKKGFTPPLLNWVMIDFREEIEESLREIDNLQIPINSNNLFKEWTKLLNNEAANVNLIWAAYMLIVWKRNIEKIKIKS